jgi:hypothetical protein
VSGQAILARLISFGKVKSDETKIREPKPFAWSPRAKRYARRLEEAAPWKMLLNYGKTTEGNGMRKLNMFEAFIDLEIS